MNDDDFEKKLRSLTGALHRPDPTPAWKADILARARREASGFAARRMLPPRWLMLGWAACWLGAMILHAITPDAVDPVSTDPVAVSRPAHFESNPLTEHRETLLAMLAQSDANLPKIHP